MREFQKGRYRVFVADKAADLQASFALRDRAFQTENRDRFDEISDHVLIKDCAADTVLSSFRMMVFPSGRGVENGYSGQFYGLEKLSKFARPMLEIGRFCTDPARPDPDLVRAAWAAVTRIVDAQKIGFLFGCTSFDGVDPAPYAAGFAHLAAQHLAPDAWRPRRTSTDCVNLAGPDQQDGAPQIPPLLRGYLALGGRVSDHAVMDHGMNTMHVFTGVDVAKISPARTRLLRAMSA